MKEILLRAKIEEAEQQLTAAEGALASAIGELRAVARAEKTVSSGTIERALDDLRTSKIKLSELKKLLDVEEGA